MFYITLEINDRQIGRIGVWNTQEYDGLDVKYQVHDVSGGLSGVDHIDETPHICDIWHDRRDGASGLAARVMDEIDEDLLDDF